MIVKQSNILPEYPFLENSFEPTKNLFYLCQNKTCDLPTTNFDALWHNLVL